MKKIYPILLVFLLFLSFKQEDPKLVSKGTKFILPKGVTSKDYLPNTLIVKFKKSADKQVNGISSEAKRQLTISGITLTSLNKLFSSSKINQGTQIQKVNNPLPDLSDIYVANYQGNSNIENVINALLKDEQIIYAEPSYIYKTSFVPNDPGYVNQNYLNKVMASQAWDVIKNTANVIIGIVDSGSDLQHEDLIGNTYINTNDPVNGVDDDGDGYIDNFYGWDFVGNSASTMIPDNNPDVTSDTTDHGVHVSGIASAVSNNNKGVASIAYNAKLMIIKTGADNNGRAIYKGYEGIKYAADHGATVINCSWGGAGGGQFGQDIIDYAVAKGCLVIAAAGNDDSDVPDYPAFYKGVLAVASVSSNDIKSSFSNFGNHIVISAPGNNIYNTLNESKYGFKSGTSMAAPLVASAAALVKAKYPNYTGQQIGEVLRTTADPIDVLNANFEGKLGKGRLNVLNALTQITSSVRSQNVNITDQSNGVRAANSELSLKLDLKSFLTPITGLNISISSTSPYVEILNPTIAVGALGTLESITNVGPIRVKIRANTPQNEQVTFKFKYVGNGGAYTDEEQYTITVALDYLNVTLNKLSTTFSSNGRVGYSKGDATGGLGLIYKDENMLFEAALMIGKSTNQVSNNARNDGGYNDDFVKQISAQQVPNSKAAFEAIATFIDANSTNPIGLKVKSSMLAFANEPDDKYVIAGYEIFNTSSSVLEGVYTGLFTDWDLDESSANATRYDPTTKIAYAYAKKNASYPYAGVKLLSSDAPPLYYPMSYQIAGDPLADGKFTIAEKFQTLNSGIKSSGLGFESNNGNDIMYTIGTGPYTIPVNGSIKVAYAFIAGDNLTELLKVGEAALTKYTTTITNPGTPIKPKPISFILKQNYPNPSKDLTSIDFDIAEKSITSLVITNMMGKVIATLVNETLDAGSYTKQFNLSNYPPGIYFYKLKAGTYQKALKLLVIK